VVAPTTLKVPTELPPGIFRLGGSVIIPGLSTESVTVTPEGGADAFRVTVPFIDFVTPTVVESNDNVRAEAPTLIVALPGLKPEAVPKIVVEPCPTGVIEAVVLVEPSGIVTEAGAVATVGSKTVSVIFWPPLPGAGAAPMATVSCPGPFERFSGSGDSMITGPLLAVIVSVDG
jgi:hypothetical protein